MNGSEKAQRGKRCLKANYRGAIFLRFSSWAVAVKIDRLIFWRVAPTFPMLLLSKHFIVNLKEDAVFAKERQLG